MNRKIIFKYIKIFIGISICYFFLVFLLLFLGSVKINDANFNALYATIEFFNEKSFLLQTTTFVMLIAFLTICILMIGTKISLFKKNINHPKNNAKDINENQTKSKEDKIERALRGSNRKD